MLHAVILSNGYTMNIYCNLYSLERVVICCKNPAMYAMNAITLAEIFTKSVSGHMYPC